MWKCRSCCNVKTIDDFEEFVSPSGVTKRYQTCTSCLEALEQQSYITCAETGKAVVTDDLTRYTLYCNHCYPNRNKASSTISALRKCKKEPTPPSAKNGLCKACKAPMNTVARDGSEKTLCPSCYAVSKYAKRRLAQHVEYFTRLLSVLDKF
jgi:hypothetical protein